VLSVADYTRPFVVHTDASDYAVGAVLSQRDANGELRPISFMSQKLSDVEYRWSVYEKELFSVVSALPHWSMWLMHARHTVEIHNDHASLRFLMDQPKLTAKQTRWIALLSTFADLNFVHVSGSSNTRADALSRRADHDVGADERQRIRSDIAKQQLSNVFSRWGLSNARITALVAEVSAGDEEIAAAIVEGYINDPQCCKILSEPSRYGYRLRWDLLERVEDGSILVPGIPVLRSRILRCIHDAPTSGHLGIAKTYDRLTANYHWPNAWLDVAEYVKSCDACQQAKPRSGKEPGLSQSIEPHHKGHTIALDFLGPLQMTPRGKDAVLVIVDSFTKRVFLEAIKTTATAEQVAKIVVERVVRHQGVPRCIRGDRDSRFTGKVWSSIWSQLGSELDLTTAFHHEANGQVEHFMLTLTNALRIYSNEKGSDWDRHLITCEIAYNTAKHSATGMSPIELDIGIEARLPISMTRPENESFQATRDILDTMRNNEIEAFRSIVASQERGMREANKSRREERYHVGDQAWLDTSDLTEMTAPGAKKLRARWTGPFDVIEVHGDAKVRLATPTDWRIHPIFHINRLRRAHNRDTNRFPEPEANTCDETAATSYDLSEYDERGAAIAQIERDEQSTTRPRTRAATQIAHDRGERHDFLELTDAWHDRRQEEHRHRAEQQRYDRIQHYDS
jgi:RNase H-like domain found in reverse transcriptase/Integrase zinc binding domain